jgi:predicted deacylase
MRAWHGVLAGVLALSGCLSPSQGPSALPVPSLQPVTFADYHDSQGLDRELRTVQERHPGLVRVEELGRSVGGKPILLATVTAPVGPAKPVAFIDGCHHGNENQGCEGPLFLATFLADNYARNATVRWILDTFQVDLVPDVNPDGHDAQTRVNANGVNLNRNYPTDHGDPLGLSYPLGPPVTPLTWQLPAACVPADVPLRCPVRPSENGGVQALDQPEAAAIAGHMAQLGKRLAFYLTFHTAAHSVIAPWAAFHPPHDIPPEQDAVLVAVLDWTNRHTTYDGGRTGWLDQSGNLGYAASGTSMDWAYDCCGVPSFTFETHGHADGQPEDVNWWGQDILPVSLKLLMNTDLLQQWKSPEREFPYPAAWQGVHVFEEAPARAAQPPPPEL